MKTLTVLHRTVAAVLITAMVAAAPMALSDVGKVSSLRLVKSASGSRYVIEQTGSGAYQEFLLNNPKRLVVDIVGARHALETQNHTGDGNLVKRVRSSQFTNEPDEVTRIVFEIDESAEYKVSRLGANVEVSFFTNATAPAQEAPATMGASAFGDWLSTDAEPVAAAAPAEADKTEAEPKKTEAEPKKTEAEPKKTEAVTPAATEAKPEAKTVAPAMKMDQEKQWAAPVMASQPQATNWSAPSDAPVMTAAPQPVADARLDGVEVALPSATSRSRAYPASLSAYASASQTAMSDDKITMDVQGADIKTVLRSVSEFSNRNIIAGPDVEGPITVHLKDVPWRQALDMILKANGYGTREEYGIIRVRTLDKLHDEELDIAQVAQKKEDLVPMITHVVELNFTNAKEMEQAMSKVTTKRGSISVERGTNAVIINDIPVVAERIAAMISSLDKKVQQVEILARMVDIDVEATREIGIRWDFLNIMGGDVNMAGELFSGQLPTDPYAGLRMGSVNSWGDVMLAIEALEKENKADIISNPRITTADNSEANILVGKEIPLIVSDEAGNPITELKKVGVTLRVTPHVNSDNTITLDLHPEISELSSQATVQGGLIISLQEADTRVLVRNGETAVIGGLIQEVESTFENGVPGLKDIPLLGALFKFKSTTRKKRELIIFVTPTIVSFDGPG